MSERPWTSQQLAAMENLGTNMLVAAGAGSGKTAVLIERLLRRIQDRENPLNMDQFLMVTFTNAAAQEMRERLAKSLNDLVKQDALSEEEERRLSKQIALLPQASITTLHGFCLDLLRKYYYHLELDGNFKIANEGELLILEEEILDIYLEEEYDAENQLLPLLADAYGGNRDDEGLRQIIKEIYTYSRSQPKPEQWLDSLGAGFDKNSIDDYLWSGFLASEIREELAVLRNQLAKTENISEVDDAWHGLAAAELGELNQLIVNDLSLSDLLLRLASLSFANAPKSKSGNKEAQKQFLHLRTQAKNGCKNLQKSFCLRPPALLAEDLRSLAPLMQGLKELIQGFSRHLALEKRRRNLIDFSDMEHFCLALLENPELSLLSELRQQYREILVDEYQDINGVQERILNLLSSGHNVFAVGDLKQSIYRFRLAEPALFLSKYQAYTRGLGGKKIELNRNFRSSRQIIAGVNFVFRQLMSAESAEFAYDDEAALRAGLANQGQATEFLLLDCSRKSDQKPPCSKWESEAKLIAKRIVSLHEEGRSLGDIAVLLRSAKNREQILMEELQKQGISAVIAETKNSLKATEMALMLSVLRIIDNPRQDIPLTAVLLSPLGGFTPDELVALRLDFEKARTVESGIFDALVKKAEEDSKAQAFLELLGQWRNSLKDLGISQLIWKIYQDTGFYHLAGTLNQGKLRQNNLLALYRQAQNYEKSSYQGLFRFIRYLEELEAKDYAIPVSRILGEREDSVTIMSIHRSKGLEFPVVFLAGTGHSFNFKDQKKDLLIHKDFGLGPKLADRSKRLKFPSLAHEAVSRRIHKEAVAEEMRILYVAMTRAKEQLLITGSVDNLERSLEKWSETMSSKSSFLPSAYLTKDKKVVDWLGRAMLRHPHGARLRDLGGLGDYSLKDEEGSAFNIQILAPDFGLEEESGDMLKPDEFFIVGKPMPASPHQEAVEKVLNYTYPLGDQGGFAAKWTVSQVLELLQDEESAKLLPGESGQGEIFPKSPNQAEGAAERGSAFHSALELIDIRQAQTEAGIIDQLEKLAAQGRILSKWLENAELKQELMCILKAFYTSDLGRRLAKASHVQREIAFTYQMPLKDFAPYLNTSIQAVLDGEKVVLQGMADLVFAEGHNWVLVDYKSGGRKYSDDQLSQKYGVQLGLYRRALENIWGVTFKDIFLYMLDSGRSIKLEQ